MIFSALTGHTTLALAKIDPAENNLQPRQPKSRFSFAHRNPTPSSPLSAPFSPNPDVTVDFHAMEATTEILKEFMLFPKLPIELRHRIFSYIKTPYAETHVHAIRGFPANVLQDKASTRNPPKKPVEPALPSQLQWPNADYVWPKKKTPIAYLTWHLKGGRFLSTTAPAIHPLLQTCHESRKFFIDKFDLVPAFGTLFNLNRDILFLDASTAIHYAEVNNPGIEAFAELLRHPDLIKKIKRLAFHVQIQDYLWLGKCAEKIKGQLASLEELYLVCIF